MKKRSGFGWIEFICGLCMIVLGFFTIFKPQGMFTWLVIIYGFIAIVTGICDIIFYIKAGQYTGFAPVLALVCGIFSVMIGTILLSNLGMGRWILSILFPLWFIAHCISRLMHLNVIRFIAGSNYYYFSTVFNILGLVLGIVMLFNPMFTIVTTSTLIGIYLIISGVESIVIAFSKIGAGW